MALCALAPRDSKQKRSTTITRNKFRITGAGHLYHLFSCRRSQSFMFGLPLCWLPLKVGDFQKFFLKKLRRPEAKSISCVSRQSTQISLTGYKTPTTTVPRACAQLLPVVQGFSGVIFPILPSPKESYQNSFIWISNRLFLLGFSVGSYMFTRVLQQKALRYFTMAHVQFLHQPAH